MPPNPGQPTSDLLKKAYSKAKRLTSSSDNYKVLKISTLLSQLRLNKDHDSTYKHNYESVSENVNKLLNLDKYDKSKNYNFNDLKSNLKVYTYNEVDDLVSSSVTTNTGSNLDSNKLSNNEVNAKEVTVFGWCKSVRKQDGGRLLFVILNDGSCKSNLQLVVHKDSNGYESALKCNSGSSVLASGLLVDRSSMLGNKAATDETTNKDLKREDNTDENNKDNNTEKENKNKDNEEKKEKEENNKNKKKEGYLLLDEVSNKYELHITKYHNNYIKVLGTNMFPDKYPIAKKSLTLEHLRDNAHLRPRSYLISAVMRVRNVLSVAVHLFFQSMGCNYLNSPIITTADCEGAGELFQITTLFENAYRLSDLANKMGYVETTTNNNNNNKENNNNTNNSNKDEENNKDNNTEKENKKEEKEENNKLKQSNEVNTNAATKENKVTNYKLSYKNDFFKKKSYLTCSGQLSAENYCCSMGSVYTFGPTFRAENSHTSRHLAEFWMIEPELLLVDLPELMNVTEKFVKFLISYVLKHCYDDLYYFDSTLDNNLLQRLNDVVNKEFVHVSYTDVIDILQDYVNNNTNEDTQFEYNNIYWGMDLQSEHERFVSEKVFNGPVIIYNYPKDIKAFYMRRNEDGKTVAAMDLIIPKIGELIGGSQREERLDYLLNSIKENKLDKNDYWWYLDLRRYGTVTHSGFGLGFERLIMMVTGVSNIRDVIPFPRYPGHSAF